MKHLISIDDIGPDDYATLFKVADRFSHLHSTTISQRDMAVSYTHLTLPTNREV